MTEGLLQSCCLSARAVFDKRRKGALTSMMDDGIVVARTSRFTLLTAQLLGTVVPASCPYHQKLYPPSKDTIGQSSHASPVKDSFYPGDSLVSNVGATGPLVLVVSEFRSKSSGRKPSWKAWTTDISPICLQVIFPSSIV